jgi:CRISPR-associated protein Cmr1
MAKRLIMALKFKEPQVIRATYRIVTPMFIGDAEHNPADGVRSPSVKGALRFWWRALNWGRFWQEKNNELEALKALHEEEARLFGSSMDEQRRNMGKHNGQGCFVLSVTSQPHNKDDREYQWPPNNANHGASYLAYGLLETQDDEHKAAIPEGGDFTITLTLKTNTDERVIDQLKQTLQAWSLFGGIGSRSRRSFGSVTLLSLNGDEQVFNTKAALIESANQIISQFGDTPEASFTALNQNSIFKLLESNKDAREVVRLTGQKYKDFRSDLAKKGQTNKRISFGLPLQNIDQANRRSSPLLFHVHKLGNDSFVSSALYMPSKVFHPQDEYKSLSTDAVKAFIQGEKV